MFGYSICLAKSPMQKIGSFESTEDELSFEPQGPGLEVKRCALLHPIYMHEGSIVWNLDEFRQDLDAATTSKRSFTGYFVGNNMLMFGSL